MQRLLAVTALASCGMAAIFSVIIVIAVQPVADPVFASVPWLILFLFFAEMLPLFAVAHDLYRTALAAQGTCRLLEAASSLTLA